MEFPQQLWEDESQSTVVMIRQVLDLFEQDPVILTDVLTNSVYFNEHAEGLFGESGEALVNRATYSLLGFENHTGVPSTLADALLGKAEAWRGYVKLPGKNGSVFYCEASALKTSDKHIAGVIRFDANKVVTEAELQAKQP
ncbi:MAG: PAS domain-containing protein [Sumerlaeia bacterium]